MTHRMTGGSDYQSTEEEEGGDDKDRENGFGDTLSSCNV